MHEEITAFICSKCGNQLHRQAKDGLICLNGHAVVPIDGVYNFLDESLHDITLRDAVYHESVKESWLDLNQLDTLRNKYYHEGIVRWIKAASGRDTVLVELGGGVGYDLELLMNSGLVFRDYIFSEISHELAVYVRNRIGKDGENVTYSTFDAGCLPFIGDGVDIIFMVAALHHFPDLDAALAEMCRVVHGGGYLLFGIEPNSRMIRFLDFLKKPLRSLMENKSHSAADEVAEGFTIGDFRKMASRHGLDVVFVQPVWFFSGFLHYGLELLYRALRLKKRIHLPHFLEKICIAADELFFRIKPFRGFAWHYTVALRKPQVVLERQGGG